MAVDVPADVVDALAGQYRPQAFDGFAHDRHMVCPRAVVPVAHDRRTGRPQGKVDPIAGEGGNRTHSQRQRHRVADTDGQRADFQGQVGRPQPDRGRQRERVIGGHLADPEAVEARVGGRLCDFHRFVVGPVKPKRQGDLDVDAVHSIDTSLGWSSSTRPDSSREASLTWKWAVAVKASRNRRCSGELS
ncbi:hypothetical protein LAUMK13_01334 [Mycobacterium innocens]|uniref:Uncharacterized protein n=1 Tax=Mycobacterium innocens TaxID=2341083 RepID=A0A498PSW6_9MYCO|nr:hypothetical protein LAUMK13_01334 [Mycobacterium innocens]